MKLLNLGCGKSIHSQFINIDFISTEEGVIPHNLLSGIPFQDNLFDVVYHSHLLEHFSKNDAFNLIKECYRVLKFGGIIRIAVPDLETIAKEYLKNLNRAINNDHNADFDYEWIILELYDQTTRNQSGGEMAEYLNREEIPNKEYVFERIGDEARTLHQNYMNSLKMKTKKEKGKGNLLFKLSQTPKANKLFMLIQKLLIHTLFKKEIKAIKPELAALEIGQFRLSGEVHQCMYDRYSLSKLLNECGFKNIKVVSAFKSAIKDWEKYQLDGKDGIVRKPDSLFIEACK